MYLRCGTYPQHKNVTAVLSEMPWDAWRYTETIDTQAADLARQATPEQLIQAMALDKQRPDGWWDAIGHVLSWATAEQLTVPVIEQLRWDDELYYVPMLGTPGNEDCLYEDGDPRWRHIVEHIQQRLLGGDKHAWEMFLGIVEEGTPIGEAAELANAVEHQHRLFRHGT